jgi:aspartate kinase
MIVLKFGGTSVQDNIWIDKAIDIAADQIESAPLMISSAMGKTTNRLVEIADYAAEKNKDGIMNNIETLKKTHLDTAGLFLTGDNLKKASETIIDLFEQLFSLARGLFLLQECTLKSRDTLLSFGERLSTTLIYHRALERGIKAELLDSRDFIITDDNFSAASPLIAATDKKIKEIIKPEKNKLIIAQGFISSSEDGSTTTLGRGGSDFTATIIGSALDAEEVQIWTDVDGILTSDPRLVKGARTMTTISYVEAAELAFFGAKVVHPSTIQPAVEKRIPVVVKNTRNPAAPGTRIIKDAQSSGLTGIAGKKNITLINITSSRMLNAYGFLSKIFTIFNKYQTPVDLISTSEVSVSMTIEDTKNVSSIVSELELIGKTTVESNCGIVCLVGKNIWKDSDLISKIFKTLSPATIKMISLGASDVNLSMVLDEKEVDDIIIKLHKAFFE